MTLLALLHDVHDAEYVLQQQATYAKAILVSTHESVNDYLMARGRKCESISFYVAMDELVQFHKQSDDVYELLNDLDNKFEEALSAVVKGTKGIGYFFTLYRYFGRYEYTNILKIRTAVSRLVREFKPDHIHLFLPHTAASRPSFFDTDLNIYKLAFAELKCSFEAIVAPLSSVIDKRERQNVWRALFNRGKRLLLSGLVNLNWRKISGNMPIGNNKSAVWDAAEWPGNHMPGSPKKIMLLLDGRRTIQYIPGLAEIINDDSILPRNNDASMTKRGDLVPLTIHAEQQVSHKVIEKMAELDTLSLIRAIVLDDFTRKFDKYVLPLLEVLELGHQYEFVGGVWRSPPTRPSSKVLLSAYLLQMGIPLIGRQHGGNYGVQNNYPCHFDSDFRWCTHYFSWGFTSTDLKETYPDVDIKCEILPVGGKHTRTAASSQHPHRDDDRPFDILFPITNASFFHRDTLRIPQHLLAHYQRKLLQFLDQLKEYKIVVKPFYRANYGTSAFKELLRDLNHVEIIDHLSFKECLVNYKVRSVLIEYPSSPLFEAMHEETEILVLTNEIIRYNPTATELLQRRVHLFDNLPDLEKGLQEFLGGRLPVRRDNGFVEKYLTPSDPWHCAEITREIFEMS